jgi:hypothetical protein
LRKHKSIKIDDKEITVRELRVKDLIELLDRTGADPNNANLLEALRTFLPKCSDLTVDDLTGMAPSEIKQVYDAFKEVNEVFFETARGLGLGNVVADLKNSIRKEFSAAFADSFSRAMSPLKDTDTAIS